MGTYEDVHAGDVVLGHDGQLWGVSDIWHVPQLAVVLIRHGQRIVGYPPAGTPITVVTPAPLENERRAADAMIGGGLGPLEIISEHWESGS